MSHELERFSLAGTELSWPIGSAAGMTNHPDIEVVARRFENIVALGLGEAVLGSVKLGPASGGNAHVQQPDGTWEHLGGDEYADAENGIGHNAKGLPGPGVNAVIERIDDFVGLARAKNVEISLSVSPHSQKPLEEIPELLEAGRKALLAGVLRVEFNLSCPNIPDRPPFFVDRDAVREFIMMVSDRKHLLLNRFGHPGIYAKFGPMGQAIDEAQLRGEYSLGMRKGIFGGVVTSNTVPGQGVILGSGENAIQVNGGKAGRSGPHFDEIGRDQLEKWLFSQVVTHKGEVVSVLGVSSGLEVARRMLLGADLCQLGSVIYWPELVGEESAGTVVEKIKREFVNAVSA